jgi:membrane associated rhomboid family serine protease
MIFPYLKGLLLPMRAPATYFLLFINVLVFAFTFAPQNESQRELDDYFSNSLVMRTQGQIFSEFIESNPEKFSSTLRNVAQSARTGDRESLSLLGSLALRNSEFMSTAETLAVKGDEVALAEWQKQFRGAARVRQDHPSYQWGVSSFHRPWTSWITYQFAHSGEAHIFWNMVFLLIFGTFVESLVGSSLVILTYLGAGLAGVFSFALLTGISSSPLIGASASISGLMGLVLVHCWKEKVCFFYWLLPVRGYYGFVLLPAWLLFPTFFLTDLAGHLASVPDFNSVAYSAHLGGAAFGGLVAFFVRLGWLQSEVSSIDEEPMSGSRAA